MLAIEFIILLVREFVILVENGPKDEAEIRLQRRKSVSVTPRKSVAMRPKLLPGNAKHLQDFSSTSCCHASFLGLFCGRGLLQQLAQLDQIHLRMKSSAGIEPTAVTTLKSTGNDEARTAIQPPTRRGIFLT